MLKYLLAIPAILIGSQLPVLADVVPPGTQIPVRVDSRVDVSRWDRGRIYVGQIASDVYARDGDMAIPRGSHAELIVRQTGPDQFTMDLESITVNGRRYVVDTAGPQYNMPQARYENGSGVLGAIVGAIAGANEEQVETRGQEIRIPAGSVVTFQLQEPLRVVNWGDPGYNRGQNHYHRDRDWYR